LGMTLNEFVILVPINCCHS